MSNKLFLQQTSSRGTLFKCLQSTVRCYTLTKLFIWLRSYSITIVNSDLFNLNLSIDKKINNKKHELNEFFYYEQL